MQMRSFAMLLPCGISLFSGVEFVCCPKHFKGMHFKIHIEWGVGINSLENVQQKQSHLKVIIFHGTTNKLDKTTPKFPVEF